MAFILEKISDEDRKKYGIDELNNGHGKIFTHWLREKERDIFLVEKGRGPEPGSIFFLYRKGSLFRIISQDKPDPKNRHGICYEVQGVDLIRGNGEDKKAVVKLLDESLLEKYKIRHPNFLDKYTQKITIFDYAKK